MEGISESRNSESQQDSLETLRGALTQALHEISSLKTQLSQRDDREAELKDQLQGKERLLNIELSKSPNQKNEFHDFPNVPAQRKSEGNSHALESSHDKDDSLGGTSERQIAELKDLLQKKDCLLIKAVQKGLARNVAYNNVLALLSEKENELDEWKNKFETIKESQGDDKAMEELLNVYQAKEKDQLELIQQRNLEIDQLRKENQSLRTRLENTTTTSLDRFWQKKVEHCENSLNLTDKQFKLCMSGGDQLQNPNQNYKESVRSSMSQALHEVNALRVQLRSIEAELKDHYREKECFLNDGLANSQPQNAVHVDAPVLEDKEKMAVKIKEQQAMTRQETGEYDCWYTKKVFQRSLARNIAYHNVLALLSEKEAELMEWKKMAQDEIEALKVILNDNRVKGKDNIDLIQKLGLELEQLRDRCESLEKSLTTEEKKDAQCGGKVDIDSLVPDGDQLQVTLKNTAEHAKKKKRHNTRRRKPKNDQDHLKTITS